MASRAPKRRKLTPPQSDDERPVRSSKSIQKAFFKSAVTWDLEQDYETRVRKGKKPKKESTRLPIKTADGRLQQSQLQDDEDDDVGSIDSDVEVEDDIVVSSPEPERHVPEEPQVPEREQIRQAQEKLAKFATDMSENPEEHFAAFRKGMAEFAESKIMSIQKLALVTQMAVYKDIIPGYRIRPLAEKQQAENVSKEVDKLRSYEQSLIKGYQTYVNLLTKHAKADHPSSRRKGQSISSIAIMCACSLVKAVPHFNFRTELLKILVGKLSKRTIDADFVRCRKTLENLFRDDEEGRPSMEAVSLLSKMMRARDYRVDEATINLFLHLRLLSEFTGKGSQDRIDNPDGESKNSKQQKKHERKKFLNKRERKALKEQRAIEKDMEQADALVSHEERDRMQSETLKLVFATYFRVLKLRVPHLMGAVLEGLAKYAHLINQDFFGDLLEALKDLIRHAEEDAEGEGDEGDNVQQDDDEEEEDDDDSAVRNTSREALLCIVTAFTLLAGQDAHNARSTLHLDLSHFTTHLFKSLYPLSLNPDLELTSHTLRATDPNSSADQEDDDPSSSTKDDDASPRVNVQTTTVLLLRALTSVLLPPWNIRSVPPLRLAAFTKQLMTTSLHMPEKSTQAVLALLQDITHTHGKKVAALWRTDERKGDGVFNGLSDSVEGSNPFATTVWEGEMLRLHYSPKVRETIQVLEKSVSKI
ncbi:nucleolar complex-associated protein [Sodiomyces alkalinus F11]|uniref:Nucleolar complex-associated protein 3 n=1 Tax=Sodiomyces alkalinus (strain CBS 110278 / VKM F-3762 / F11) TaxID=1314773 RepID=A0A3N2PNB4_SODAK|nr:nucleolar complex-associated protein [Sodiomyces alkalinus F11]ROT35989.1 nucleolar complex-associated protein [Sodiomyces alkalinus F11]